MKYKLKEGVVLPDGIKLNCTNRKKRNFLNNYLVNLGYDIGFVSLEEWETINFRKHNANHLQEIAFGDYFEKNKPSVLDRLKAEPYKSYVDRLHPDNFEQSNLDDSLLTFQAPEGSLILSPNDTKEYCDELYNIWISENFNNIAPGVCKPPSDKFGEWDTFFKEATEKFKELSEQNDKFMKRYMLKKDMLDIVKDITDTANAEIQREKAESGTGLPPFAITPENPTPISSHVSDITQKEKFEQFDYTYKNNVEIYSNLFKKQRSLFDFLENTPFPLDKIITIVDTDGCFYKEAYDAYTNEVKHFGVEFITTNSNAIYGQFVMFMYKNIQVVVVGTENSCVYIGNTFLKIK